MAVAAAVWCRLQLAVVGAHINAAAPRVAVYGLPRGLMIIVAIALLHGASARYLIHAAAESAADDAAAAGGAGAHCWGEVEGRERLSEVVGRMEVEGGELAALAVGLL